MGVSRSSLPSAPDSCVAVVLAGGQSRRFGSDKLQQALGDASLLDRAMEGLPDDASVVVVGPPRPLRRPVDFVREQPPGGGPAAALVTGLVAALAAGADWIVVLPGDAPRAGHAAALLLNVLRKSAAVAAVVGTDASGFDQPLQLALGHAAAQALVAAAGPDRASGGSARALVNRLDPPALRHQLPLEASFDIDTPDQLRTWVARSSPSVAAVLAAVDALGDLPRPVVVALDGPSGAGKSWLATALALQRPATVVHGDDFYNPRLASLTVSERHEMAVAEIAESVIDWRRLRAEALEPLVGGQRACFTPYDWEAEDGRLGRLTTQLAPAQLVIVDGVYSGRPELAELVDVAVWVQVDEKIRRQRLLERADHPDWRDFWQRGEQHYFASVRRPSTFDLQVTSMSQQP